MAALRTPRRVLFASDFSGLDSAWLALQRLKVPAKLQFCSDNDPNCKALLNALHGPGKFFDEVTDRQPEDELESDVFVFTPPCQPYSSLGKKKGAGDKRSQAMKSSFQYIKRRRPRLVVFENVRGLTFKKFRPVLLGIHAALKKLDYVPWLKVLDAAQFKVPQIRRRVFIVAIRKDSCRRAFKWPKPLGEKKLDSVLDPPQPSELGGRLPKGKRPRELVKDCYKKVWAEGLDPRKVPVAVDIGCTEKFASFGINVSRTLTRARGGTGGFWISNRSRKTTTNELIRVSGLWPSELQGWEKHVSKKELGHMLGNTVPVPLIGEVLQAGMYAAGLISAKTDFPVNESQ